MMCYRYARPESEVEPGPVLLELIGRLRQGDVLIVPNVTHLAYTLRALRAIIKALEIKGAKLDVLRSSGKRGAPDDKRFEVDIRHSAIVRAKARGAYSGNKGRPVTVDVEVVRKLKDDGLNPSAIAAQLRIGRASVYRALAAH
jgi:DNA invertase Pin-like site-specific DNA recombinase